MRQSRSSLASASVERRTDSLKPIWYSFEACTDRQVSISRRLSAHSADPDQPFRPIVITDSGDLDHAVHYA
jgi:hypothetical protein